MNCFFKILVVLSVTSIAMGVTEIPETAGNVSSSGFTKLDFCNADGSLYAFNGLHLYRYSNAEQHFEIAFAGAGSVISEIWDPADFAFMSDSNNVFLSSGQSMRVVYVDRMQGTAAEKSGLRRNYYSSASRYRDKQLFANGVGTVYNTIYLIDLNGQGME